MSCCQPQTPIYMTQDQVCMLTAYPSLNMACQTLPGAAYWQMQDLIRMLWNYNGPHAAGSITHPLHAPLTPSTSCRGVVD